MAKHITITFPDTTQKEFPTGATGVEIAHSISPQLAKRTLGVNVENGVIEATRPIQNDTKIQLLTWSDELGKNIFWHSSAHLLAESVQEFFPNVRFAIGPPIENGFYYDIDLGEVTLSTETITKIEKRTLELAAQRNNYERIEINKEEALAYYKERNNPYKIELIEELKDGEITFYKQGKFLDLCKGPHLPHTGFIKAIKILNVAGAYWRGNEKNTMLTRLYAISFPSQKELEAYMEAYAEAKKRDHRKIGKELDLFTFSETVGMGLPLWLPKGTIIREELQNFLHAAQKDAGYQGVITPHIGHKNLYITSGHYEKYGDDSFQAIQTPNEGEEFFLKPMNCPHHCELYKASPKSYRELPLRLAEFGTVYRYEQHGELHGLTRVRSFTQDDAHIFCQPSQLKEEFLGVIALVNHVFQVLHFEDVTAQVSLRDNEDSSKYIGDKKTWLAAENAIIDAVKEKGMPYHIEYGEAAFYGPKLDFMVKDALGRKWQLGTIQVDYNLPKRFQLEYIDSDGEKKQPVMIHRAPFGSLERFVAILIENYAGNLPVWLSPTQAIVLPISDQFVQYALSIKDELTKQFVRVEVDNRGEKISRKIRDAEVNKIPYMLIVGAKEQAEKKVSVRRHTKGDIGTFSWKELQAKIYQEIKEKKQY